MWWQWRIWSYFDGISFILFAFYLLNTFHNEPLVVSTTWLFFLFFVLMLSHVCATKSSPKLWVCVCLCLRARQSETERDRERIFNVEYSQMHTSSFMETALMEGWGFSPMRTILGVYGWSFSSRTPTLANKYKKKREKIETMLGCNNKAPNTGV